MLPALVKMLEITQKISNLKNACWALSNLVRGKPSPDFEKIKEVYFILIKIFVGNSNPFKACNRKRR